MTGEKGRSPTHGWWIIGGARLTCRRHRRWQHELVEVQLIVASTTNLRDVSIRVHHFEECCQIDAGRKYATIRRLITRLKSKVLTYSSLFDLLNRTLNRIQTWELWQSWLRKSRTASFLSLLRLKPWSNYSSYIWFILRFAISQSCLSLEKEIRPLLRAQYRWLPPFFASLIFELYLAWLLILLLFLLDGCIVCLL